MRLALVLALVLLLSAPFRWALGSLYTIEWWHGAIAGVAILAMAVPVCGVELSGWRLGLVAVLLALLTIAYAVPWGARERFVRDLHRIEPGQSRSEARSRMGSYRRGPKYEIPGGAADDDCDQFRYDDSGPDEFDVGIVCYSAADVVTSVLFSSD